MNIKKALVFIAVSTVVASSVLTIESKPALADWNTPWFTVDLGWGNRNLFDADWYCQNKRSWFNGTTAEHGQFYYGWQIRHVWAQMANKKCILNLW